MAYKKEYPILNDSGAGSLEEYTKRQEDRIESGFEGVDVRLVKLENSLILTHSGKTPLSGGGALVFPAGAKIIHVAPNAHAEQSVVACNLQYQPDRDRYVAWFYRTDNGNPLQKDTTVAYTYVELIQ